MLKILKTGWVIICCIVLACYFLSCLTPAIPPEKFSFISLFAIAFPYLFVAGFVCGITLFFIRKNAAAIILVVVIIAGFKNLHSTVAINSGGWQMQKNGSALRVMTWNAQQFVNLSPKPQLSATRLAMLNAINTYKPDVLCVQELEETQNAKSKVSIKAAMDSLGFVYSFFSRDKVVSRETKSGVTVTMIKGVGIFSKIPLYDTVRAPVSDDENSAENMIYADVLFNSRPVRIYTAHLASFEIYTDTASDETGGENLYRITYKLKHSAEYKIRETELKHSREVAIIRDSIAKSPYPIIYCGDINATPASYTYYSLKQNRQDAFIEKGRGFGTTFYKLHLRIDVCLPGNTLKVLQCTVPQLYLSDHFPVVTDVAWR